MTGRRPGHLVRSAGLVMAAFAVDKVVGFGRQAVIANVFGVSSELDAYFAAFQIPDLIFTLISGGALATAFIPILSERLTHQDRAGSWRLTSAVINVVFVVVLILAVATALLAPILVRMLIAPGFTASNQLLTANLMRLVLLSTLIFSISGILMGVLNAHQHFLLPAIAPILYNLGLIFGALVLSSRFGVFGLVAGAIVGAGAHLLIQVPGLIRYGARYSLTLGLRNPHLRQVARLMGPRVAALVVIKINFLVIFNLASRLGEGSVSALSFGWLLMQLPQTIIGTALGIVVFPTLSELAARGDVDGLRGIVSQSLRVIFALSLPAAVGLIALGTPIIQVLFQRGEFDAAATQAVYQALRFWALALVGHAALEIANRTFYAQKDTLTPLYTAMAAMIVNLILALLLYRPLNAGGLALANAVAVSIEVLLLLLVAHRRLAGVEAGRLAASLARSGLAALVMGAAILGFGRVLPQASPLLLGFGGGVVGLAAYVLAGLVLGIEEIRLVPHLTWRR
jgi:putative peptidoglycan lipid II flippase